MFAGDGQQLPDSPQDFPDFFQAAVWQHERCPRTGRLHAQMYAEFNKRVELSTLQNWWPGLHVEVSRGSAEQNKKYCTKEESRVSGPWTFGDFKKQGLRTDLIEIHQSIAEGASMREIVENNFSTFVRYRGGIEAAWAMYNTAKPRPRPRVLWFVGPPGTGKSRAAHVLCPDAYVFHDLSDRGWFDRYCGQKEVILDEFVGKAPLPVMLQLFDYHPFTAEQRGHRGGAPIAASMFIVTSNLMPEQCYPFSAAFKRRIDEFGTIFDFPEMCPVEFKD